ncbi:MAG: rhamnulose-1-phosphate aldolase [Myxococcota bacterium]|jgi:rhamnulose-1-phosphate aldolase
MNRIISSYPLFKMWLSELSETSALLWNKGWAEANAGNVSIDVTDTLPDMDGSRFLDGVSVSMNGLAYPGLAGRCFLVSGSGCRFRDIARDPESGTCVIQLSSDGREYRMLSGCAAGKQPFKPTSELPTHLMLHSHMRANTPDEKVVLHTHPTELVALSHLKRFSSEASLNKALWGMLPEVKVLVPRGVGVTGYMLPGSVGLARATAGKFEEGFRAVIWEKHGCLAAAKDIVTAFDRIDALNKGAQVLLHCISAGEVPDGLSAADLDELARAFNLD